MVEAIRAAEPTKERRPLGSLLDTEVTKKLVSEMLAGRIGTVKPQYDFSTEMGYSYPIIEQTVNVKSQEAQAILESMAAKGIVNKSFFDRLIRCPRCNSVHIRPSSHCPKCGSGHVTRGRVFEHFACRYVGLEAEFTAKGKYVCPKCRLELRAVGGDYQSLGILYKCRDCAEIFNVPFLKWRCLKCSSLSDEEEVGEVVIYSYAFDESKRNWLEFELQPKVRFLEFLRDHGYNVMGNARLKGRSGAEHGIEILATRDDGVITHTVAVGIEIARERVGLDRVLDFDVKAYDTGIHDKILIVIPELSEDGRKFATYQRIKVLEPKDLEILLSGRPRAGEAVREPFQFKSKSQLIQYLEKQGYMVREKGEVKGRSGAVHNIDILAIKDEGIILHRIAIGVEVAEKPTGLDRVFDFNDKAYDSGILDKVLIAVPGLTKEAMQFAKREGIKVIEAKQL